MKSFNIRTIALLILFNILISISIFLLASYLYNNVHLWLYITLVIFISSLLIYLFYRFFIQRFINEKIKILYKVINTLKTPQKDFLFLKNNQGLKDVENDVLQWVQDKKDEIEKLKESEIYRREFVGNVSHELKTPIFNIQGYILTLLEGGMDDPIINKEYLVRAEKNINRMISIVEDLETISLLESGQLKLQHEKFDVVLLMKEVMEALEIKAQKKNIKINFETNYVQPILVFADRERIRQVLTNLTDNSIKYNNVGGTTKIGFFDMDDNILVEVEDNGIGISTEHISRIFERFYRVDKSRSREQGGSGLGLAIVKHIIDAHTQNINVKSTIGIGTNFAFTLKKG